MQKSLDWIEENKPTILENIKELLRIPSVSSDKENYDDVFAASRWVQSNLERIGLETRIFQTPGFPVVFAQTEINPNKKTVLVYFHYDVQPSGEESLWENKPFDPIEKEGNIFGRGTTDDKMQGMIHFYALEAMVQSGEELPVNFKFCIEGEEEISSPHVMGVVKENEELFRADYIVVSDGPMLGEGKPNMEVGARGILYTQIRVSTGEKDLHSGLFGGFVQNPNFELARIISSLKNSDGQIAIPHFYDGIIPPTPDELKSWGNIDFKEEQHKKDAGVYALDKGENGYSLLERNWARPTLEINGMWGGFTGEGSKTVIPHEAFAKISMRLVPGQDPQKILQYLKEFLKTFENEGRKIEVQWDQNAAAFFAQPNDPVFSLAQDAYGEVYPQKALLTRTGGTVGLMAELSDLYGKPILFMNFGMPDENLHAPNEFMRIDNFFKGIQTALQFYFKLRGL